MAIERYTFSTVNDLKSCVQSTGLFDTIDVVDTYIECKIDGKTYLKLAGPEYNTNTAINAFYTKGYGEQDTRSIVMSMGSSPKNLQIRYAYKTKNGLLLTDMVTNSTNSVDTCRHHVLLGITNTGAVAVCMSAEVNNDSQFYAAAMNETDRYIGTNNRKICIGGFDTSGKPKWIGFPQVVPVVIPTCPSSGKSWIKGAFMFSTPPMDSRCIMALDGITLATDGTFCLTDEG